METTFNGINLSSRFVGEKRAAFDDGKHYPPSEDRHHVITAELDGREIQFDYYPSIANPSVNTEKELLWAFWCFILDAEYGEMELDDYAEEMGGGKISQILASYKLCEAAHEKFLYLFKIDKADFYDKKQEMLDLLEEEGVA